MPGPWMMGWGWYGGFGMGIFGMVLMLLFWGLIIAGLVLGVRWLWDQGRPRPDVGAADAPLEILKRRYAKGEINKEEFDRMKKDLA